MKLVWDTIGERFYETGVDRGVLYPYGAEGYGAGVAWSGLTAVNESPSGAEASPLYADNIKFLNLMSTEDLKFTIEAYMYPDEFAECDGSYEIADGITVGQQTRKMFGFSYRTKVGSDENADLGYKIHLIYGCLAAPSAKNNSSVNESPEAATMSWEVSTTPINVNAEGFKPTASLVIDSRKVEAAKLKKIEDALYGTDSLASKFLTPDEVLALLSA